MATREEVLPHSLQEHYKGALEAVDAAIFVHDLENGLVIYVNRAAAEMYGYAEAEMIGTLPGERDAGTPPYSPEEASRWVHQALHHGPQRFKWHARKKTGELFWVEVGLRKATIGGIDRLVATVRDISQEKHTFDSLLSSERRFGRAFQDAGIGMTIASADGYFLQANRAFCEILGYTEAELRERTFLEITHPDDREESNQWAWRGLTGEVPSYQLEKRFLGKNGSVIRGKLTVSLVDDPADGGPLFIGQVQDITPQRTAEETLRHSEERYRTLVESMSDGLSIVDTDGAFTYVNRRFTEILQRSEEELLGAPVLSFLDEENQRVVREEMAQRRTGSTQPYQLSWETPDGNVVYTHVAPSPVRDAAGEFQGSFAVITDITALKELERERHEYQEGLHRAQALGALGRLAGGVAHDFNNLLGSIIAHVYTAQCELNVGDVPRAELESIQDLCKRGGDLTRQLLAVAGHREEDVGPVDLADALAQSSKLLERTLPRTVRLETFCDPGIPAVRANRSVLTSCLLNLALNARDAMPDGGTLTLRASRREVPGNGTRVVLEVEDTGNGIAAGHLEQIFDPFFTTKPVGEGSGLGLATTRGALRTWGGDIGVASSEGEGTRFTLEFLCASPDAPSSRQGSPVDQTGHPYTRSPVLLVEDEEVLAHTFATILELSGYRIIQARTGLSALEKIAELRGQLGLVILDLLLPGLGGDRVYHVLQRLAPEIPVLVISGRADLAAGLAPSPRLVAKPFTDEELLAGVASTLTRP